MKKRILTAALTTAVVMTLFTACGNSDSDSKETTAAITANKVENNQNETELTTENKKEKTLLVKDTTEISGFTHINEYEYDDNDNVINQIITYIREIEEDGTVNKYVNEEKVVYEYNETGNLIKETTYDENGEIIKYIISEYDSDNHMIKQVQNGDENIEHTYQYDEIGNCIQEDCYREDGSFIYKEIYTYDSENNMTSSKLIYDETGEDYMEIKYIYDEAGNCIKTEPYGNNDVLMWYSTIEYDESGNKIKEIYYRYSEDEYLAYQTTTYEYEIITVEE